MDKEKYTPVEIEVIAFDAEDIITQSDPDDVEMPEQAGPLA